jgi:8-oxo-dGTP diphosphatase
MNVRPSVVIFHKGHILTMRYSYSGQHVYGLPGGNPDPDETLMQTLRRELQEEMNVDIEVGGLIVCAEMHWPEIKKDTLHMVFEAEIISGLPSLNTQETTCEALVWIPLQDLSTHLLYPNISNEILEKYTGMTYPLYREVLEQPYLS